MKKTLYLECNSGISGDMTVGALLDLGADRKVLEDALASLGVDGYHLHFGTTEKCGIKAYDFDMCIWSMKSMNTTMEITITAMSTHMHMFMRMVQSTATIMSTNTLMSTAMKSAQNTYMIMNTPIHIPMRMAQSMHMSIATITDILTTMEIMIMYIPMTMETTTTYILMTTCTHILTAISMIFTPLSTVCSLQIR